MTQTMFGPIGVETNNGEAMGTEKQWRPPPPPSPRPAFATG